MIRKWFSGLPVIEKTVVLIVFLLFIGSIVKSTYYTINYGGVDLRQRIVGARMISHDQSPYFGKWSPGQSERLMDPNLNRHDSINGVTVAPGTLYILYLFSGLSYFLIRILWALFQYILIGYIFLYFFSRTEASKKFLLVFICSVFFLSSSIWFLHIERGQVYILYAFFFTLLYQLYCRQKKLAFFFAGFLLAFAIYCRPTFIVLLIPFLFIKNRWLFIGFICCGFLLMIDVYFHFNWWRDYSIAMSVFTGFTNEAAANPIVQQFPKVIEGMDNLTKYKTDFSCGGIKPIHIWIENFIMASSYLYLTIYAFVVILLVLIFKNKLQQYKPASLFLFGFALYIIAEYIMPAPRGAYNLIQWIFPVLLLLKENFLTPLRLVLLMFALCLVTNYPYYLPFLQDLGELILLFCLLGSLFKPPIQVSHNRNFIGEN